MFRTYLIVMGLVSLLGRMAVAEPCLVDSGGDLTEVAVDLDDGMGGTTNDCLNEDGLHEVALSGTIEIDAPLVLNLGEGVDLHGPAKIVPSSEYALGDCVSTDCPLCGLVLKTGNHRVHDLTIADFPHAGLCADGEGHLIHHVTVNDVLGDGIRLKGTQNQAVWNNVQGTHGDGIALYGASNVALQNTIGGYDHFGLALYGTGFLPDMSAAMVASNTFLAGTDDGQCSNYGPCAVQKAPFTERPTRWPNRQDARQPVSAGESTDVPLDPPSRIPEDALPIPLPDAPAIPQATDERAASERFDQSAAGGCALILRRQFRAASSPLIV